MSSEEKQSTSGTSHTAPAHRKVFFKRSRRCPFEGSNDPIDYKDTKLLRKFLTPRGKIMPRRLSFVSMKRQRELACAIKRARFLGLLPYVIE
jgi:small subunit ribosomal protein S18